MTEPNKIIIEIIIEMGNLGEDHMRTIKRELKTLVEDYAWNRSINISSVNVKEGE